MKTHNPGEHATTYRADDGQMVVIVDVLGVGIFHRANDDTPYTQCFSTGGAHRAGYQVFDATYSDPRDPKASCWLRREEGSTDLDFNGTVYHLVDTPEQIEYDPLPTTRKQFWCYRLEDGRILYASELKYNEFWPMGGFRAYLGTPGDMKPLTNPQALIGSRTGISDRIRSTEGSLWLRGPYWDSGDAEGEVKVQATFTDLSEFDIVETDEGLTLTLKEPAPA